MLQVRAGNCLLVRTAGTTLMHLWFVLTDPEGSPGRCVGAMLTTRRRHSDTTVILRLGDHPFIKHESTVDFGKLEFLKVSKLHHAIEIGQCYSREDMSADLLRKVRAGLLSSPRTVEFFKRYCTGRFGDRPL